MQFDIDYIKKLEENYALPLYIFDEEKFIENYQNFETIFKNIYKNYRLSYSYKTNYTPYICSLVKKMGGYAEVVSEMEYTLAKKIGYDDKKIVFNGPDKEIFPDCILNVDNFSELEHICKNKKIKTVGIRVNIDIGQNFVSRFGFDDANLEKVFNYAEGKIDIVGLHCHVGRSRDVSAWEKRTKKMLDIADRFFPDGPEYISLGSGMSGDMDKSLAMQFPGKLPTYNEYAQATAAIVASHYANKKKKPILFTEPGTTIVNKYIDFIAKVKSIKIIKGKTFIVLNCSKHNLGEICELKNLPISIIHCGSFVQSVKNASLVGYTCLEHDVMYKDFSGEIGVGDYIVFGNVGGYSNVSKPPFIRPNCAMITKKGKIIKRKETFEDVFSTYVMEE